jgi:ABC-type lipoprotein release transport system permease subunit
MIWRMAWRNLWRNRTRTLILGSVIAFAYGFTLVGLSIGDDSHDRMLDDAIRAAGGQILVHADGFWATRAGDLVVDDADRVVEALESAESVARTFPRVLVSGLASTSAGSRAVQLQGVVPDREAGWLGVLDDLVAGTFLGVDSTGTPGSPERSDPLVLGALLVERLELELGDRVVVTASDPAGDVTRALFHLTGVVETGTRSADETLAYTTLAAAREALGMEGELTQVGLLLEPGADPNAVAASLRSRLEPGSRARAGGGTELEVLTWRDAVPEMVGFVELDDAFGYIYMAVIFVVVLFSITNTFLMAVLERVRELGLLNALGLRGTRVGGLLLAETVLLTALAMAAGLAFGVGVHLAVDHWGIDVAAVWGLEDIEISGIDMADMVIRSTITPAKWVAASVLVAVASLLSALYPAWKATRLAPAEAMRFYE